ncbi:hypothetical protein N9P08_02755 [Alphaproteobacteria bacterium]|nr:hypothetical protein [Alphaproteobacteria bacterium]
MMKRPPSYISNTKAWLILALASLCLICFDEITSIFFKDMFNSSSYNFVRELERTNSNAIILGSSTAARGIDPAVFDAVLGTKTYSFARDGTGIFYATSVLRNIPKSYKLQYVIFGIDPASFVSGFSSSNFRQIERLLPYAIQDDLLRSYLDQQISWLGIKMLSSSYRYIYVTKEILKDVLRQDTTEQNGFSALDGAMKQKKLVDKINKTSSHVDINQIADESLWALEAMHAEIKERGARLVLVTLPIYNDNLRSRKPENVIVMSKIKASLFDGNLCDLSELWSSEISSITRNNKMFYDSAHLNRDGSKLFTSSFAKNVKALCLP